MKIPFKRTDVDKQLLANEIKFYAFLLINKKEVGNIEKWSYVIKYSQEIATEEDIHIDSSVINYIII